MSLCVVQAIVMPIVKLFTVSNAYKNPSHETNNVFYDVQRVPKKEKITPGRKQMITFSTRDHQ